MDSSFPLLPPRRTSVARVLRDVVDAGRTPPTACLLQTGRMPDAGDGAGVKEDAAWPRVIRRGIDSGGAATEGSGRPTVQTQVSACEKDAARPRAQNVTGGSCET